MIKHILILILIICAVIPFVSADPVSTTSASVNTSGFGCVVFIGESDGTLPHVWFEYGAAANVNGAGNWFSSMRTDSQTVAGTFTDEVCGAPFIPGKSYKVRAAGGSGNLSDTVTFSAPQEFAMPTITPIPTTTYSVYMNEIFTDANHNDFLSVFSTDLWAIYVAMFGELFFFGIIIGLVFMNLGVKQSSIIIPLLLFLIVGTILIGLIPPEFMMIAEIFLVLGIAGTVYWLYRRRR